MSGAPGIPGVYTDTVYAVVDNSPSDLQCVATNITDFTPTTLTWWKLETTGGPQPLNIGSGIGPGGILPLDYTFTRDDQDVVFYCESSPPDTSCGTKLQSVKLTMDVYCTCTDICQYIHVCRADVIYLLNIN